MIQASARETIEQAISDFDDIRDAIRGHRIAVDRHTKTSLYGHLIANIRIGSLSGTHSRTEIFPIKEILSGHREVEYSGTNSFLEPIVGTAENVAEI